MHRAEPTVRLSDAPPTPADQLAKACADLVLTKFLEAGLATDSVQVIAYVRGHKQTSWISLTPHEPRAKAVP